MNIKDIKSIYKFIKSTDIVELEVEGSDGKIKIKRGALSAGAPQQLLSAPLPVSVEAPVAKEKSVPDNVKLVTSPMVGTFYKRPSADTDPFVEVGGLISAGQPLCIIEAMKLFNEVESDYSGKVLAVLVDDGSPVEYGEPLFQIEVKK